MTEARTTTPWRASRLATQPIRRTFSSRSWREKPRSRVSSWRAASPSSSSTGWPAASRRGARARARVVLPAEGRPVNHTVSPPSRRPATGLLLVHLVEAQVEAGRGAPRRAAPGRAGQGDPHLPVEAVAPGQTGQDPAGRDALGLPGSGGELVG